MEHSATESIRDYDIEKALAGQASPELLERISQDPAASRKLAALRQADTDFLARYPADRMARQFKSAASSQKAGFLNRLLSRGRTAGRGLSGRVLAMAMGGSIPLVLLAGLFLTLILPPMMEDGTRTKGMDQGLVLFLETDEGPRELKNGSAVPAYARVQMAYRPASHSYGFIFSLDGRGRLTLHYPEDFSSRPLLDKGSQILLPFAYQLDDAPRFERFYLACSNQAFSLTDVWANLEAQANDLVFSRSKGLSSAPALTLPPQFSVRTFDLVKTEAGQ